MDGSPLHREILAPSIEVLNRIQADNQLSESEQYAVSHLCNWLEEVDEADEIDDKTLDESALSYLKSYRESYSRRKPYPADRGGVVGPTPRVKPALLSVFDLRKTRTKLLVFVVFSLQLPQSLCLQTTSLRTCSLDVTTPHLAEEVLQIDNWNRFDVFQVGNLSKGKPLETVTLALFTRHDLLEKLKIPYDRLQHFVRDIERAYNSNPYHNNIHAADVTQTLGCFLANDDFAQKLTDLEVAAMIFATCIHDVGHPGVSNDFLVNTKNETALVYNDVSVNENMHLATAFKILRRPGNEVWEHLSPEQFRFFRRTVIQIVLATDMAGHSELLQAFTANLKLLGPDIEAWGADQRNLALRMCVHCADIANPAKPLPLALQWTQRVVTEFFNQGDSERKRGMPVSALCDREKVEVPKSQLAFLTYVVKPTFEALKGLAPVTAGYALDNIDTAVRHWEQQVERL
ncbi:hypothetical protein WJX77_006732 [Trebouxia sp. C0004]